MSDWTRFSNGLPILPVTEIVVDEVNSVINASTFARGIWRSDLYSDCGPFLLLEGEVQGQQFYQSNGFIETSQTPVGSFGNALRLHRRKRSHSKMDSEQIATRICMRSSAIVGKVYSICRNHRGKWQCPKMWPSEPMQRRSSEILDDRN